MKGKEIRGRPRTMLLESTIRKNSSRRYGQLKEMAQYREDCSFGVLNLPKGRALRVEAIRKIARRYGG